MRLYCKITDEVMICEKHKSSAQDKAKCRGCLLFARKVLKCSSTENQIHLFYVIKSLNNRGKPSKTLKFSVLRIRE